MLALLLLLVFMFTVFDWNWVRPGIERYLSHTSQRRVHFDSLQVRFSSTLAPTVILRGVEIENAPWAARRPFARVGEVRFVFDTLRTLFDDDQSVVSHLILIDADVDLERQADGLRNWRLRKPEYRGPGKYKVLRLEARNSRIRFVNREIGLDLEASSAAAPPAAAGAAGPPLPSRIRFSGHYAGTPFDGDLLTANELSLQETGEFFPLRGTGSADGARLELDGRIADFFRVGALDAQARISGTSLRGLSPFVRTALPASPPFRAAGRLRISQTRYALEDFHGTLGESDLAGSASLSRKAERRHWDAQLRSRQLRWADLRALADGSPVVQGGAEARSGNTAAHRVTPADHVLPRQPWPVARLRAEDGQLRLEVARFVVPAFPALQSLEARAQLKDGVLTVAPFDLGIAGGHATGQVSFDATRAPAVASVRLQARQLSLESLTASYPAASAGGALGAHLELSGVGDSLAALLASAGGSLVATVENGRISNLLDAKLGLNGGKLLWLKLAGDRSIALRCATVALDFRAGVGRSRSLLLDSDQTRVNGSAIIDLRQEHFDLLLRPQAKQGRVFALGSAIHASGSFRQAGFEITKGDMPAPQGEAGAADCAPAAATGLAAPARAHANPAATRALAAR
jgi:uncharacterized protein involved in outer membrane biogenesis